MKVRLKKRERSLLAIALFKYDRLCQGTSANLNTLNLPTMAVETARGNITVINERLGTSGDDSTDLQHNAQELELQHDLVVTIQDAIHFTLTKYEKMEKEQTELLIPLDRTDQTRDEMKALQRKFGEQLDAMPEEGAARPSAEGIAEVRAALTLE